MQFNGEVGTTTPLASLTVNPAATVTSNGSLKITTVGDLVAGNAINSGGDITLTSQSGSISVEDLSSAGSRGGAIALAANNDIVTGAIAATGFTDDGGTISLMANDAITTETIDSSSLVTNGGSLLLESSGDIQITWLNAQGGANGSGGTVDITTGRFFRATDSFIDRNSILASLSTAGGTGSGAITIRHGGNGIIPFDVGAASQNGTAAAITSGVTTIDPFQSFPFTEIRNNIRIISVDQTTDNLPAPPRPIFPPVQQTSSPLEATCDVVDTGISALEGKHTSQFEGKLGITSGTSVKGLTDACTVLGAIAAETGMKPALIYVSFVPASLTVSSLPDAPGSNPVQSIPFTKTLQTANQRLQQLQADFQRSPARWRFRSRQWAERSIDPQGQRNLKIQPTDLLELIIVTPETVIRKRIPATNRQQVQAVADALREQITNPRKRRSRNFLASAQQLHQWLIDPIASDLRTQRIDNLVFIMDIGLRSLPLAALHNGQNYLIERYSVGLMPSLSLTDTRYVDVKDLQILAMGAAEFAPTANQDPLPGVPIELNAITRDLWAGQSFLNKDFTPKRLQQARKSKPFGIIHLATHAEFWPDDPQNSYIQFWNQRRTFKELRAARLFGSPIELAVFSACRTALGSVEEELGFAGLAVQAGVKSALGSLWYVSDEGTSGFMTYFYSQLKQAPIKAEAVRQTQLAMLRGEVYLEDDVLVTPTSRLPLPPALQGLSDTDLSHPYFWSGFVLVGNPW